MLMLEVARRNLSEVESDCSPAAGLLFESKRMRDVNQEIKWMSSGRGHGVVGPGRSAPLDDREH